MSNPTDDKDRTTSVREIVELTEAVKSLLKLAEKHEKALYGNGNEDKSVLTRLDRLEQIEKHRTEQGKDLRSILLPIFSQMLGGALVVALYLGAGHVLGILH